MFPAGHSRNAGFTPPGHAYAVRRQSPARAFAGMPVPFCRPPPPRPRLRRDTRALLPAPPPRRCLRQGIPVPFCRPPHPAGAFVGGYPDTSSATPTPPAPSALLPRPHRGRGPCVAISGEQPYPALFQGLPMLWTVGISPRGVGPTGRGNEFPLPCLPHSNHLTSRRQAIHTLLPAAPPCPRLRRRIPARFCRQPPPRLRLPAG